MDRSQGKNLVRIWVFLLFLCIAGGTAGVASAGFAGFQSAEYIWQAQNDGELGGFTDSKFFGGYSFSPKKNGFITELCGYFEQTNPVELYDASFNLLVTAPITSYKQWNCVNIDPVPVEKGREYYVVGVFEDTPVYYRFKCCSPNFLPISNANVTVNHGVSQNLSLPFGAKVKDNKDLVLGMVDVKIDFRKDVGTQGNSRTKGNSNADIGKYVKNCGGGKCVVCAKGKCFVLDGASKSKADFAQTCYGGNCFTCSDGDCIENYYGGVPNSVYIKNCIAKKCVYCSEAKCVVSGAGASGLNQNAGSLNPFGGGTILGIGKVSNPTGSLNVFGGGAMPAGGGTNIQGQFGNILGGTGISIPNIGQNTGVGGAINVPVGGTANTSTGSGGQTITCINGVCTVSGGGTAGGGAGGTGTGGGGGTISIPNIGTGGGSINIPNIPGGGGAGGPMTVNCSGGQCTICIFGTCFTIGIGSGGGIGGGGSGDDDNDSGGDNDDTTGGDDDDNNSADNDSADDDSSGSDDSDNDSANDDSAADDDSANNDSADNDSADDDSDGNDTVAPAVSQIGVSPKSIDLNEKTSITAKVTDASGVKSVKAEIKNFQGQLISTIILKDDGNNKDGNANDDVFGRTWNTTGQPAGKYDVTIIAEDTAGNFAKKNNAAKFEIKSGSESNDDDAEDGGDDDSDDSQTLNKGCGRIFENGLSSKKLDIVFVPCGYSSLSEAKGDANAALNKLFSFSPFPENKEKMNAYIVESMNVQCQQSTAIDQTKVAKNASAVCPGADIMVLLMPNVTSGSIGGATFSGYIGIASKRPEGFPHEFGHSFCQLDDEYTNSGACSMANGRGGAGKNCSPDSSCSKWSGLSGTGCVAGCSCSYYYRAKDDCVMNLNEPEFCPVCKKSLISAFGKYQ